MECFHFEARHCQRCKRSSIDLIRRTGVPMSHVELGSWQLECWDVGKKRTKNRRVEGDTFEHSEGLLTHNS